MLTLRSTLQYLVQRTIYEYFTGVMFGEISSTHKSIR